MDFIHGRPIRVQPYFGYRTRERLWLTARALRAGTPDFARSGRVQAIRTMVAQFASREVPDLPVTLVLERPDGARFVHQVTTDREGYAHFDIALEGDWTPGDHTRWEIVSLEWRNRKGDQRAPGHVLTPGKSATIGVISDIDDTIIETGITGNLRAVARNWRRVLAEFPEERIAVPGVDLFYNALGGASEANDAGGADAVGVALSAPPRPFFYVSSSPWNLYSYLVAFKRLRGLPLGPIALRDWGLNRQTFGSTSHGTHKSDAIARILAHFPDLRFALIGDDTQGDLTAYGAVVRDNPQRIAAVFIRKAAAEDLSPEEIEAKAMIERAGVPLWMGEDYQTGEAFLAEAGLSGDGDARQIVETVETKGT